MSDPNPFQSPVAVAELAHPAAPEIWPFDLGKSIFKWLLICAISGGPSFYFGLFVGGLRPAAIFAMIAGIATFAAFYVYLESRESVRRKIADRRIRRALWIGYGTRIVLSIIPLAALVDMWCGVISVGLCDAIFGGGGNLMQSLDRLDAPAEQLATIPFTAQIYFTTLVQGVLLNIILGAYTLIVLAICYSTMSEHQPGLFTRRGRQNQLRQ